MQLILEMDVIENKRNVVFDVNNNWLKSRNSDLCLIKLGSSIEIEGLKSKIKGKIEKNLKIYE